MSRHFASWILFAALVMSTATATAQARTADGFPVGLSDVHSDPGARGLQSGRDEAERDFKKGRYRVLTYGYPAGCRSAFGRILQSKYGIELDAVAGCVVTSALRGRVRGYNEVMGRLLTQKFGFDPVDAAAAASGC